MEFILPEENSIHGAQLVDEIEQALGIEIGEMYTFNSPNKVILNGFDQYAAEIQTIIEAHVPDPRYFARDAAWLDGEVDFSDLIAEINNELDYLDATIPEIDTMDLVGLRAVLKRLAQENRRVLKAFRFSALRF